MKPTEGNNDARRRKSKAGTDFKQRKQRVGEQFNAGGDIIINHPPATPSGERLETVDCVAVSPEEEKAAIEREFVPVNLDNLERLYVEPKIQNYSPPDVDCSPDLCLAREPAFSAIRRFMSGDAPAENGGCVLFVLADAGMGKTSLLLRLKQLHWGTPWRAKHHCVVMKLGHDTLARLNALPDPQRTVLLLDSLDEDPEAHRAAGGADARLAELLPRLCRFARVVVTCRIQFFPETTPHLVHRPGRFSSGAYACPLMYLSPFDDAQVEAYLTRRFPPDRIDGFLRALGLRKGPAPIDHARAAAQSMESLRLRPLLLTHIDDFVGQAVADPIDYRNRYAVYRHLVDQWLKRERADNKHRGLAPEQGWQVATELALYFARSGKTWISRAELAGIPGLEDVERFRIEARSLVTRTTDFQFGFAHRTFQEFLVARALLKGVVDPEGPPFAVSRATIRFLLDGRDVEEGGRGIDGPPPSILKLRSHSPLELSNDLAELIAVAFGIEMVVLPSGRFRMGSPDDEKGRGGDEGPQHDVELTHAFALGRYPITCAQYEAITGRPRGEGLEANHPVANIDWNEAVAFCGALNRRATEFGLLSDGIEFRLPTEAEWEYACRAGTTSAFNDGSPCTRPTGKDLALDRLGWFDENSGETLHPIGQKQPNAWGLYDMHGNVWEWCLDGKREYRAKAEVDPLGSMDGSGRVVRGGSCWNDAWRCRSAYRLAWDPGGRYWSQGFRLALGQRVSSGATEREAGPRDEDQADRSRRAASGQ